ncbi:hypothetical protein HanRHA438_Chr04g0164261 [Helianthus annuus]|nr:hypothetical protein HanIR_Chr04g0165981 [Helianthus annuus]KAJ0925844.1 hypothetical protein HanRHA438_Chr04g0164261 [Helianthus annuus]
MALWMCIFMDFNRDFAFHQHLSTTTSYNHLSSLILFMFSVYRTLTNSLLSINSGEETPAFRQTESERNFAFVVGV